MRDMTPVWVPKPESRLGKILCWLGYHVPMTQREGMEFLNGKRAVCPRCKRDRWHQSHHD